MAKAKRAKTHLIGIESKRYEPFRGGEPGSFSELLEAGCTWMHSLGLRTRAVKMKKIPVLAYLHAQPVKWPGPEGNRQRAVVSVERRMNPGDGGILPLRIQR